MVSNSYKCLHKLSRYAVSSLFWLPRHYGQLHRPFRQNFSPFDNRFPPGKPLTFSKICDIFSMVKAKTKTCVGSKILREGAVWCKASVTLQSAIPLPSRVCGNATPGAPVNASMSDGRKAVTRVEPWNTASYCIPPLILSGDGYFLYLPHIKKEVKQNGKRKPVHL